MTKQELIRKLEDHGQALCAHADKQLVSEAMARFPAPPFVKAFDQIGRKTCAAIREAGRKPGPGDEIGNISANTALRISDNPATGLEELAKLLAVATRIDDNPPSIPRGFAVVIRQHLTSAQFGELRDNLIRSLE